MTISGARSMHTIGKRFAGMLSTLALSLTFAGDSSADLRHNYLFNSGDGTTIVDSQSGANGTAIGGTITTADSRFVLDGVDNYGDLPAATIAINTYTEVTFELWSSASTVHEGDYTAAIAFGTTLEDGSGSQYILMQPTRGGAEGSSGQITPAGNAEEVRVNSMQDLSDGKIHHTVLTITSTELAYYVDGQPIGTAVIDPMTTSLAQVSTDFAYLGDSVWTFDPILTGSIYEFRIYDDAKDAAAVAGLFTAGCADACGDMYLEVDRATGAATLRNTLSAKDMVVYEIASASGALIPGNWLSFTDNYDQDSGGATPIDPDDNWEILSMTQDLLSEQDPIGQGAEDGAVFESPVALGNIWTQSPYEDLEITITVLDENFLEQDLSVPVFFVGNNDQPFSRSDFDLDNEIGEDDYLTLRANHMADLGGTFPIDTFALGDVNGDLLNDYRDFRLFKADFIAANGEAAFASMVARHGAVPEPGTLGLMLLGLTACALTARRKQVAEYAHVGFAKTHDFSERQGTMNCISKVFFLFAFWLMIPSVSHAQSAVFSESFDTRADLTGLGVEGGATVLTLVDQGGGDNALQFAATSAAGGFFATGFTIPALEVEPGPGGPNTSPILSDYQLSFDLTINAINGFTPNLEIWLADGPRFATNSANLYTASGLVDGVNSISFTLDQNLTTTTPNGFTNPGGAWSPTADDWWLQVNSIDFGAPAGATVDYTIDNIQVTIDVATSLALVVDPTSGQARIRNASDADVTFDYYRIESTNGSLLTADFNGTTGWDSLDDQGVGIGSGFGESWDEVAEANSADRLVEQFLLGETTLGPDESLPIGAPVDPAMLANQIGTLALRFGGPAFPLEGVGEVIFEDLSSLLGDFSGNGAVENADLTLLLNNWAASVPPTPQGWVGSPLTSPAVDNDELTALLNNWGASVGAGSESSATAPEPACWTFVIVIGLVSGAAWRRRTMLGQ